jgi:hypothetical protein
VSKERGFIDAFSDAAESYASARPSYPRALFQTFASLAPATLAAWDCGTGNGRAIDTLANVLADGLELEDADTAPRSTHGIWESNAVEDLTREKR